MRADNILGFKHGAIVLSCICSAAILILFHNYFFWPQDEGVFGHIAERLNRGEIYGKDFYDIHGGYHTFLNAELFNIFGRDFVVLRYPLILLGVLQTFFVSWILRRYGFWVSFLAGVCATSMGFIQYLNPSPNWYALFFAYCCVLFSVVLKDHRLQRNFLFGLLIGLTLIFRHPSGIFLGLGVLTFLITETASEDEKGNKSILGQLLCLFLLSSVLMALIAYNFILFDPFVFFLFSFWPIIFLALLLRRRNYSDKEIIAPLINSGAGVITAIAPIVFYQLLYGDILLWFDKSFLSGIGAKNFEFFGEKVYLDNAVYNLLGGINGASMYLLSKGLSWLTLFLIVFISGALAVKALWDGRKYPVYAPIVLIYGYVSYYYQIPFYFYCSTGLFLLYFTHSILMGDEERKQYLIPLLAAMCILPITSDTVVSHYIGGHKYYASEIKGASVYVFETTAKTYPELLENIDANLDEGDDIYVFPLNPELYFLTKGKNPFPFYGSSFEIIDEDRYKAFLDHLSQVNPRLLIFNRESKYINLYDEKLFECLKMNNSYAQQEIDEFTLFIHQGDENERPQICRLHN